MVAAHGIPDAVAYGVYLGEVVGPLMVLLGLFARIGGALIAVNMLVAVFLAGVGQAMTFNAMGGYALELEAFYFWCGLAVMCSARDASALPVGAGISPAGNARESWRQAWRGLPATSRRAR